ncbi:MAG: hypothetical protein ACRENC_07770 [Gemmatimonadaceae bacterium]
MHRKRLIVVALAAVLSLGAASPAFADCCDSFWDCAATVVTEGVSCAVQEFIDTVKGLIDMLNNLMSIASGAAENAQHAAQQAVSDMIDAMTTQSQSADGELAQAAANAKTLADEEAQFKVYAAQKVGTTGGTSAPAGTPRPGAARAATPASTSTGSSNSHMMTHTSVASPAAQSVTEVPAQAPARAFMADMNRALTEINKAKSIGDGDVSTVNRYMDIAKNSEGSGLRTAGQIINDAINAPLKGMLSQLTGMLTNPTELTSPSSMVESMANSITKDLSVNIDKVIASIMDGPRQAFDQAQPSYTELLTQAMRAQAIANAMDQLYHSRTPAAHDQLLALLPNAPPASNGSIHAMTVRTSNHIAYSTAMTRFSATREKAKSDFLGRFQELNTKMKQYENVRAKARTARSSLPTAKSNFGSQLDAHLNGRTLAERTAQRDSLIKEARAHFANDPKTRDAVINLLTTESNKRIAMIKR